MPNILQDDIHSYFLQDNIIWQLSSTKWGRFLSLQYYKITGYRCTGLPLHKKNACIENLEEKFILSPRYLLNPLHREGKNMCIRRHALSIPDLGCPRCCPMDLCLPALHPSSARKEHHAEQ